jgi:hypothetical protein
VDEIENVLDIWANGRKRGAVKRLLATKSAQDQIAGCEQFGELSGVNPKEVRKMLRAPGISGEEGFAKALESMSKR